MTCFECLKRQIHHDFSDHLVFRYGVSDSALPFGSTAVVQTNSRRGPADQAAPSDNSGVQFVLMRLPDHESGNTNFTLLKNNLRNGQLGKESVSSHGNEPCHPENNDKSLVDDDAVPPALALFTYVGTGRHSTVEEMASRFMSNSIEDHVISSLILLVEGKSPGRWAGDFLNIIGLKSFDGIKVPSRVRHPNIVPFFAMLKTPDHVNLLHPKAPYTLETILNFSPHAMKSDWHIRFLIYQILSALAYLHSLEIFHGDICPSNIMLTDSCWSWLSMCCKQFPRANLGLEPAVSSSKPCCMERCSFQPLYADLKLSVSLDWQSEFKRWRAGELSNYEYLLVLNRLAGRRWGDHTFHPVMPWVIDFSVKPNEKSSAGWRNLLKSKWHLAKGDEQLDFTYLTSEIPHHVSDECLSELAVCTYKARRLPLHILRSAVRSVYEPNEYPSTMQRLYQWTPDECIPEFYSDPQIFSSLHSGMSDLAVPSWASSPEEFISFHRWALEGDHVSQQIHHWIDITFGYKLSGEASISAKNVMLPTSDPTMPKSMGRRQLFTKPHPMRSSLTFHSEAQVKCPVPRSECSLNSENISSTSDCLDQKKLLPETLSLQEMEDVAMFCEHSRNLSPVYNYNHNLFPDVPFTKRSLNGQPTSEASVNPGWNELASSDVGLSCLLEYFETDDSYSTSFQDLLRWRQKSSSSLDNHSENFSADIFSVGCILAELYLKRPLFDRDSLAAYIETGETPGFIKQLPPSVLLLVEECIQKDWRRRPSAKCLLESNYFSPSIKSAYMFIAPLQLLCKTGECLQYASNLACKGVFKAMGPYTLEMCVPYCIPIILGKLSDAESEAALCLLKEMLKYLKAEAARTLILPVIRKILQSPEDSHMKVSLLQESFMQEVWKRMGRQVYLERVQPLIISNLHSFPKRISASAASVLLICCSEEFGIPITLNQTILPLLCYFGRGICADGIDTLVRIGSLLGEKFIVKQLIPLLRNIIVSCIYTSAVNKPEPLQSWNSLALVDCFAVLDGLAMIMSREMVLEEFVMGGNCLHVKVLMQTHLDLHVVQVAANTLLAVCQRIGPDYTTLHLLPQLKNLFDELAFSLPEKPHSLARLSRTPVIKLDDEAHIQSRMDLVLLLYPSFASIIGIEKLRQCCSTWLLLEQYLQHFHNWKWEFVGETSGSGFEKPNVQKTMIGMTSSSEYNPAKLLLNGVGWSIPQSQGLRGKNLRNYKQGDLQPTITTKHATNSAFTNQEPWFWFPNPSSSWDGPDFLGRTGSLKDDLPWKIKACILYSVRAHPGALRALDVCHDECTVFTGGVGPGFKGCIQKWELPHMNCVSGYYGHDEVVNDISILSTSGRIASCDGTIHVWNSQNGKLISVYAESSKSLAHHGSRTPIPSEVDTDQVNILAPTNSGGILSSAFSGSLYTCMHYLEADELLVVGMGNSSIRFIDVARETKLHLWKNEAVPFSFSSFVSAICCCGSGKHQTEGVASYSPWIAAGLSSGHCRLLDRRSGDIIAFWQAHDRYITKLAAPDDYLLVSSSLDKTLRVWDLRRNLSSQTNVFKGHSDGISSFATWGKDVISVSGSKIGLSSLSLSSIEGGQQQLSPQKLYSIDRGARNMPILSTICILPYSRLFVVGTEDGHLKICY